MAEPILPLVQSIRTLIAELEDMREQHPESYFGTPYRTLHERLQSALETYEREKERDERQTDERDSS